MNLRRILGFLFGALIVWLILTQPATAAGIVRSIATILETAAINITTFFRSIFV